MADRAGRALAENWLNSCDEFLDTQRRELIEREPSQARVIKHVGDLTWMIRVTLLLQAVMDSPDFPAREYRPKIAGKLLQLQQSLNTFEDPLTEAEAETLISRHFHAPGDGSAP